jgi:translation elongation factor EF-G
MMGAGSTPVLLLAIRPISDADRERLDVGLRRLMDEDPTLSVETDQHTGEVTLGAIGELQLEIVVDRLKREFHVEATVGKPRVAYKEALTEAADGEGRYAREYHDIDSSEAAFKIAGAMAFEDAAKKASAVLLEPVMHLQVVVPKEHTADVVGNLSDRHGQIQSHDSRRDTQIIRALVPLSEMFGYAADLRSRTQGRATYSLHFDHYQRVRTDPNDGNRDSLVRAPLSPVPRANDSAVALPEPDGDNLGT